MSDDSTAIAILLQLAQETRDDVKSLGKSMSALEARVSALEATANPRSSSKRDVGLVAGASTVVAGLLALLQALGVVHAPPASASPPPAITAPAP